VSCIAQLTSRQDAIRAAAIIAVLRGQPGQCLLRLAPDKGPWMVQQPFDGRAHASWPEPAEGHHSVRGDVFVIQKADEQRYRPGIL
jgi:hypothetical protein